MLGRWTGLLVACAVALAALGYGYIGTEFRQISRERYQAIAAIGSLKAEQLGLWRQARLDHASALSRAPSISRELTALAANPEADLSATQTVIETGIRSYGYAGTFVLTPAGEGLLTAGPQARSPVPQDSPTVSAALAATGAVMGDFFRGDDGRVYVDVAATVRDPSGRPLGIVVLRADAQTRLFPMLQTWPTPSPTAETVLVRRDRDEVVFLNDMRHQPGSALSIRKSITESDSATVQAVLGTVGPVEALDYRGVEVLADLRPVSDSDWFLIVKLDAEEVWAEARFRAAIAVTLIALMIMGGAGGVAAFYRQRQATQFKGLYESMRENEQLLSEAEAVGQLGSFVFDIQGDQFRSSENLNRVLGIGPDHPRTSDGWRQVVHPSDLDELDAAFQQAVQVRGPFDHQYRIIHSADKSERWVHSKARIDYSLNGTPQRMVGIIQDITGARAAEHSRLAEDQRYQRQRNALIQLASSPTPTDEQSLTAALQRLTEVAARTLEVDRVSIWRFNGSRTAIRCLDLYERQSGGHSARNEILAADNPAYFQALNEADVLAADDAQRDPATQAFGPTYLAPLGITSMMDAVIRVGGVAVGVVCCEHTGLVRRWTYDEQTFAVAAANLVAVTLTAFESNRPRPESRRERPEAS